MVSLLHCTKQKKGIWSHFPLSTGIYKIGNLKQAKEEINILSCFKFKEVIFQRHDPQEKLKNI